MSPPTQKEPGILRRLREPQALNYLVMAGAGLAVYGFIMMSRGNDAGALVAVLLAVPGILARWTGSPVLILLLTVYLFIDPGFINLLGVVTGTPWFMPREAGGFSLEDVVLAAGFLAYTIGHFRLISILYQGMPDEPTLQRERNPLKPPRRPVGLVSPDELPRTLIVAGSCLILGQTAWTVLVLVERHNRPDATEFSAGSGRLILFIWGVLLAIMAASAALVYMRSVRMTREEASLVLRDVYFQENRRETDRLQRWRKWFKDRMARRRNRK